MSFVVITTNGIHFIQNRGIKSTLIMFYEVFFLTLTQGLLTLTALNDMTWLESFSRCKLIGEKDSRSLDEFRASYMYEAWVGGFYTTTKWMVFEGCFKITPDDTNKYTTLLVKDNNAAIKTCSNFCSAYDVFTFQGNWCFCFDNDQHNTYNLRIDSRYCNSKCTCDNKKWYQGYRHVKGNDVPREDSNQSLTCSIEIRRNNLPIVFDAVHSDSCVNQRCAGIQRFRYIQWTNQWTFERVCDYFLNYSTKCVLARKRKGNDVELVEEPCTNLHPPACEIDNLHTLRYCPGIPPSTTISTTEITSVSTNTTDQPSTSSFISKMVPLSTSLTIVDNLSNEMTSPGTKITFERTTKSKDSQNITQTSSASAHTTTSTTTILMTMQLTMATKTTSSTATYTATTISSLRPMQSTIATDTTDSATSFLSTEMHDISTNDLTTDITRNGSTTHDDSKVSTINLALYLCVTIGTFVGVTLLCAIIFYCKRTKRRQIYNNGHEKENPPSASFSMTGYDDDSNNVYSEPSDLEMDKQDRLRIMFPSQDNVKHQHKLQGYDNSEYNSLNFTMQSNPRFVDNNIYDRSNNIGDYTYSACSLKKSSHPEKFKARNNKKPLVAVKPFKHYENAAYAETTIRHSEFTYDTPKHD